MNLKILYIGFLSLLITLSFLTAATAINYYVNPNGNDNNDGLSRESPFRTIQKAIDFAIAGDIVNLGGGVYFQDIRSRRSGAPDAPIKISGPKDAIVRGAGGARIFEINHDYMQFEGFTLDGLYGNPNSPSGYRDKLLYVQGRQIREGVNGLKILNMNFTNSGGEALRLRYFAHDNEIAYSTFFNTGVYDFKFDRGGKNGEAIYIGTSSNQWGDGKNPTADPDESRNNWVHHNYFNTQGNECIDVKEGSHNNLIEYNRCTGQKDTESGGYDLRGDRNTIRYDESFGNMGAGIRIGGHLVNNIQYGINNNIYSNLIYNNQRGGIKFQTIPQDLICSNRMENNAGGNSVGTYGSRFEPTAQCNGNRELTIIAIWNSSNDGNLPTNTADHNFETRWSASGDGEWIMYDLGGEKRISSVRAAFYRGNERVQRFDIQNSNDNQNWQTVFTGESSGNSTGYEEFMIQGSARYVKIIGHGNTQNNWNSLTEVSIYGDENQNERVSLV